MASYKTSVPNRPGEPCPDPSAHSHGDPRASSKAAQLATQHDGSSSSILGPDGKLSSASRAATLRYAKPHELPSFPSVGIDNYSGGADDIYQPTGPSSSAGKAATLAAQGSSKEWWAYKGSSTGHSAATLAYAKNSSPKIDLGYTEDGRKRAMKAATMSSDGKSFNMSREMFTEHPPVAIEVDEKRRKDALRASAVSMANSIYRLEKTKSAEAAKNAAMGRYTSETEGLVAKSINAAYPGLEKAAQKLAAERLAKMDPDGMMAYRQYYGYGGPGPAQSLTAENMRKKDRATRNLDADSSDDEAQAGKIRGQMSAFNAQISAIDAKKRDKDRASLMATAEKLVQARLHDMDEKVFHDTGKVPPSIMQSWEAAARAKATENSEQRMLTHGKVHVGGGRYMDQSEINAIAAARMQPILDETTATAQKQRERDEEIRLAQEERKRVEAEEKAKQQGEKAEARKAKDEEKLRLYQEKTAEKHKLNGEKAELARVKAEEKAEREKVAAEEKNLRDIKNAEQKAKRDADKAELQKVKDEEKAEREQTKAQEKEEQRQRLEAQQAKDRLFKEEQAATATNASTTTTEETTTLTTPDPVSLEASEELPTGTASEETVTELTNTPTPSGDAAASRAIAERILGAPSTEVGALEEPITEEYTEGEGIIEDDAETIKAKPKESLVADGDEEAVVPTLVADNMEAATEVTTVDEDVSPGRTPDTATEATTNPLSSVTSPTSPLALKERTSRRKSFFEKLNRFKPRSSKAPKTTPVVTGNPSVGPGIVGSTADGTEEPAAVVTEPTSAEKEGETETSAAAITNGPTETSDTTEIAGVAEPTDTEDSIYDEPAGGSADLRKTDDVSDIDDDEELRGRKSYSSNENFVEARDQFDDELETPEASFTKNAEQSPARSASKFQEEL